MNSVAKVQGNQIDVRFSERFGIEKDKLFQTLKATAFKQQEGKEISNEQMYALMVVADKYDLNPFVKEIYAYPEKNGGIVPVVGVDGWDHIMNNNPVFDGIEFVYSDKSKTVDQNHRECPEWVEARIFRKDRNKPTIVREYLDECYKPAIERTNGSNGGKFTIKGPWQTHTKRMLRHKAMIQCARVAFGYGGIFDEDEADNVVANINANAAPTLAKPVEVQATVVSSTTSTSTPPPPTQATTSTSTSRKRKQPEPEPTPEQIEDAVIEDAPPVEPPKEAVEIPEVNF